MRLILLAFFVATFSMLTAQVNYTANDQGLPYTGQFRMGVNMGYYQGWDNKTLADISAGNPAVNQEGIAARSVRVGLYEEPLEYYGYQLNVTDFTHYRSLGMDEFVALIGQPDPMHRDYVTNYCPTAYANGEYSAFFANMYEPIWDGGANGTPYNDDNYLAAYLYKTAMVYKDDIQFWEIWNEPGLDLRGDIGGVGWRDQSYPGNWWLEGPPPCDNVLQAPIYHYIRVMRIAWEVIKTVDPDSYVCLGSVGYQSFLNAMLRNTDNPNNGDVSPDFPLTAGAYFDCITFHSYPHFDGSTTNFDQQIFTRHSDAAADGTVWYRDFYQEILDQYGYDGVTYPKKEWIITEINSPRRDFQSFGFPFFSGHDAQINHLMKAYMVCKVNKIHNMQVFQLIDRQEDQNASYEFDLMGLYKPLNGSTPYGNLQINDEGIAARTIGKLLYDTEYDAARTAAMNATGNTRGYAFKRPDGTYIYAVWARTMTDLSESAFSVYSVPASLNMQTVRRYNWNWGQTKTTQNVSSQNLFLDARPVFFEDANLTPSCSIVAQSSDILCDDNGTPTNPSDDTFTFSLNVTGTNASTGWTAIINGQTLTGNYNVPQTMGPFAINNGGIAVVVSDQVTSSCVTELYAAAPTPCSTGGPTTGCSSASVTPWHEWIAEVNIGSISNQSSKWTYTDYTNLSTNLVIGLSQPISLTTGYSWVTYNEYYRIWIDFNKNGDFEASEQVYQGILNAPANGTATATLNGLLVVPANAELGATTMRVSMQRDAYPAPCGTFDDGEVEDYSVNITAGNGGSACTIAASVSNIECHHNGTPNFGSDDIYFYTLTVTGINTGAAWNTTVNGQNITGQYGVPKQFGPYPISVGNTNMTIRDAASSACTIQATATAPAPCSNGGTASDYCVSTSDYPWHDWIEEVQIGSMTNMSGKSAYSDFTNQTATLTQGQSTALTLTTGFSWETFQEFWTVWVDFNKNGQFEASEMVFQGAQADPGLGIVSASTSGMIQTPTTASLGTTRMRISMQRGAYASGPCATLSEGEVEDYTVEIAPSLVIETPDAKETDNGLFLEAQVYGTSVNLIWQSENTTFVTRYLVQKSTDATRWKTIATLPLANTGAHQYTDYDTNEGLNTYRIIAVQTNGTEKASDDRTINLSAKEAFKAFPNPTSGHLMVDLSDAIGRTTTLRLYNSTGKLVREWTFEKVEFAMHSINMDAYPDGHYFLQMNASGRKTQSLRVQKF